VIPLNLLNTVDHITNVTINNINHNRLHNISLILLLFLAVINLYTFKINIHKDIKNNNPKNMIENTCVSCIAVVALINQLKLFGFLITRKNNSANNHITNISNVVHHIAIHLNDNFFRFDSFFTVTSLFV
jgi:NADH:ubiquinone oxidoreductase subunit 6 (subunit J)